MNDTVSGASLEKRERFGCWQQLPHQRASLRLLPRCSRCNAALLILHDLVRGRVPLADLGPNHKSHATRNDVLPGAWAQTHTYTDNP